MNLLGWSWRGPEVAPAAPDSEGGPRGWIFIAVALAYPLVRGLNPDGVTPWFSPPQELWIAATLFGLLAAEAAARRSILRLLASLLLFVPLAYGWLWVLSWVIGMVLPVMWGDDPRPPR